MDLKNPYFRISGGLNLPDTAQDVSNNPTHAGSDEFWAILDELYDRNKDEFTIDFCYPTNSNDHLVITNDQLAAVGAIHQQDEAAGETSGSANSGKYSKRELLIDETNGR